MNAKKTFYTLIFALLFNQTSLASSRTIEANNFCDVKEILSSIDSPSETLTVFDDDDTLSMMPCKDHSHCKFIGTPAWFDWQSQLPKNDPQRVSSDFPGLIEASNDIHRNSIMAATGKNEMEVLLWMQSKSFHILVETARGPEIQKATERQLAALGILPLLENTATVTLETKRAAEVKNGIFYVTGQNKGNMLKALLKKSELTYKTIILVDDSLKNVQAFAEAFKLDDIDVIAIHYTQLQNSRHSFPS